MAEIKKIASNMLFVLMMSGCSMVHQKHAAATDFSELLDGQVEIVGCLMYSRSVGIRFILVKDCMSWDSAADSGGEMLDVDTEGTASKKAIVSIEFTACVVVRGSFQKYFRSDDDFFIGSGYSMSDIGFISPDYIRKIPCKK